MKEQEMYQVIEFTFDCNSIATGVIFARFNDNENRRIELIYANASLFKRTLSPDGSEVISNEVIPGWCYNEYLEDIIKLREERIIESLCKEYDCDNPLDLYRILEFRKDKLENIISLSGFYESELTETAAYLKTDLKQIQFQEIYNNIQEKLNQITYYVSLLTCPDVEEFDWDQFDKDQCASFQNKWNEENLVDDLAHELDTLLEEPVKENGEA